MNESQPVEVLDGSADLASHEVAWEFCMGSGEVDEGSGELTLETAQFIQTCGEKLSRRE